MSRRKISNRSIDAKKESLILSIYLSEAAGSLTCLRLLKENFSNPHNMFTKVNLWLQIPRTDAFSMTRILTKNIRQDFCVVFVVIVCLFQMKVLLG